MSAKRRTDRLTRARPSGRPEVQSYFVAPPPPLPSVDYGPPEPIIFVPAPEIVHIPPPKRLAPQLLLGTGAAAGVLADLVARLVF